MGRQNEKLIFISKNNLHIYIKNTTQYFKQGTDHNTLTLLFQAITGFKINL